MKMTQCLAPMRKLVIRQRAANRQIDPKLPFKLGPTNGRNVRESGLRLKASVTYSASNLVNSHTMVSCRRQ